MEKILQVTVFLAQTHIYVTDASSAEEAGSMFGGGGPDMEAPSASFSLWVPRTGESGTPSEEKHPAVEPSNQHRVKFLKTFEFGAQRGEGYRGEGALLCSQFGTQF